MAQSAPGNPYDRRAAHDRVRGSEVVLEDFGSSIYDEGRRAYPGFGLARLEEVMRDEYARGFNCGEGTMERHLEEKVLPRLKRKVWDEGHAVGVRNARDELLDAIAQQHSAETNDMRDRLGEFIEALSQDATWDRSERIAALDLIGEARDLLSKLIHAQHNGFMPTVPF